MKIKVYCSFFFSLWCVVYGIVSFAEVLPPTTNFSMEEFSQYFPKNSLFQNEEEKKKWEEISIGKKNLFKKQIKTPQYQYEIYVIVSNGINQDNTSIIEELLVVFPRYFAHDPLLKEIQSSFLAKEWKFKKSLVVDPNDGHRYFFFESKAMDQQGIYKAMCTWNCFPSFLLVKGLKKEGSSTQLSVMEELLIRGL